MAPLVLEKAVQDQLADAYAEAQGPFPVPVAGHPVFVMMSSADELCGL